MQLHTNRGIERRFLLSLALTSLVLVAEVIGGIWTGSLALLSDSAHVFMDIFALGLSFLALRLSALPADDRHTYGYHRLEVLAALINGISLGAIALGIWYEAYQRWQDPQPIRSTEMLIIAVIGLAANLVVAFVLGGHDHVHEHDHDHEQNGEHADNHDHDHEEQKRQVRKRVVDVNLNSAFLHVVGDAVSSVGVIAAAIILRFTSWWWVDPLISVLIGVLIVVSALRVLRSSLNILVEGVPEGLDLQRLDTVIKSVPAIKEVHDLHVWAICSGNIALSSHVRLDGCRSPSEVIIEMKQRLRDEFGIEHTTIQIEADDLDCAQR